MSDAALSHQLNAITGASHPTRPDPVPTTTPGNRSSSPANPPPLPPRKAADPRNIVTDRLGSPDVPFIDSSVTRNQTQQRSSILVQHGDAAADSQREAIITIPIQPAQQASSDQPGASSASPVRPPPPPLPPRSLLSSTQAAPVTSHEVAAGDIQTSEATAADAATASPATVALRDVAADGISGDIMGSTEPTKSVDRVGVSHQSAQQMKPASPPPAGGVLDTVAGGLGFGSTQTVADVNLAQAEIPRPGRDEDRKERVAVGPRDAAVEQRASPSPTPPTLSSSRQASSPTPIFDADTVSSLPTHLPRMRTLLLVLPLLVLARILPRGSSIGSWTFIALCFGALWLDGQFERVERERQQKENSRREVADKAEGGGTEGNARRGEHFTESVEWMNHALRALFPVISTDLLIPFIDLLEDAMMTQMPTALVSSVRLTTPSLGEEPIRIRAIRPMTDAEWFAQLSTAPTAPADDASKRGKDRDEPKGSPRSSGHSRQRSSTSIVSQSDSLHRTDEAVTRRKRDRILRRIAGRRGQGVGVDEDDDHRALGSDDFVETTAVRDAQGDLDEGQYVNYAVDFSFDGSRNPAGRTLHFLAYIGAGLKGLVGGEIPIWVELLKVTGTVHVRLLLSPSVPFVRTGTVSLPSIPDFDFSAKPIKDVSLDFMSLPFVKPYIAKSIRDVADAFVRPKSYTLDLDRLLLGHEGSLRTAAVGVLHLRLHGATGLAKSDSFGSSDPYCVVSFSKYAKPLFSTRTIVASLNPRWEEDAYILVPADSIESGERLLLTIFDSDRYSSDDDLGLVELDLADLLDLDENQLSRHEMRRRADDLRASRRGMRAEGQIEWSWGFFPLWQQPKDAKTPQAAAHDTPSSSQGLFASLIERIKPEPFPWQQEHERRRRDSLSWLSGDRAREALEAAGKPSLDRRSGVLQFTITQCQALEIRPNRSTFSSKRTAGVSGGKPALEDLIDSAAWESPKPPNPYCEVILNGRLVFRTRTKQLSPAPYWNAVSERFVRDWSKARIVFVVRDERDRERDPVIGLAAFQLADIFRSASQVTRTFPLVAGLGWGMIRLSLLFKAIDMELPAGVSGYEICSIKTTKFKTDQQADDVRVVSDVDEGGIDRELAVEYRHSCSLLYKFMEKNGRLKSDTCIGMAVVRLSEVPDNEAWERTIPIYPTADLNEACERAQRRLDALRGGPGEASRDPDAGLPQLRLGLFLHAGVSQAHRKLAKRDRRMQHVYEAWQLAQDVGSRADYSAERERRAAVKSARDGGDPNDDDIDAPDHGDTGEPLSARSSLTSPRSDSFLGDDTEDDPKSPGSRSQRSFASASSSGSRWRDWREHTQALHRHHQGVMSNKLARSIAQGKDKVQEAVQKARSRGKHAHRGRGADAEVEVEGISKL